MATPVKPPYIKKVEVRGELTIWIVDGSDIRGRLDEEFTNFGQHYRYPYIPEKELWIDQEADSDELPFFIDHLLVEHRLMAKGLPYAQAIEAADRARPLGSQAIGRPLGSWQAIGVKAIGVRSLIV